MRIWIRARSVTRPMAPPRASISRTSTDLAGPPMAGLQGVMATFSGVRVISRVRQPMRAAARAASQPAWPPPATITS